MPYAQLAEADLRRCIAFLHGGGILNDPAHVRRLDFDVENDIVFGLGRSASSAFYENVGTIPDERTVAVRAKGTRVGRLDESFVSGLQKGDVFLLDGRTMKVEELTESELRVVPHAGRPTVPVWSSHLKGISPQLAAKIGVLRREIAERLDDGMAVPYLMQEYKLERLEAQIAAQYVAQQAALSLVPDGTRCVIECYRMDGRPTIVFHTCAGRRVNEVLARMVAARVHARTKVDCQLTTDDAGFLLILPSPEMLSDTAVAALLEPANFAADVHTGLRGSNLLRRHFRYVATTGLLVLRRVDGRTIRRQRHWNAGAIFDRLADLDPDFPLVRETFRTVSEDILDVRGAQEYLARAAAPIVVHPTIATPFTFGILSSSFGDATHLADRDTIIEALHARVLEATKMLDGQRPTTAAVSRRARE
jgi:ATP-dependent Lhr-like helicase